MDWRRRFRDRTNGGDGRCRTKKPPAGDAYVVDGQCVDTLNDLAAWNDAAEHRELTGDLLGACARRFQCSQHRHFHLRLGARELGFVEILRRLRQAIQAHRDELGKLAPAARGIKAEQAGVQIGPVEGMNCIGEAALLAHFLEQPRGHAAADDVGKDMRGILILIGVGYALEADDDMSLLEAPLQPDLAAGIARQRRLRVRGKRQVLETRARLIDDLGVIDGGSKVATRFAVPMMRRPIG